jgi:hypothetical protein
MALEQGVKGGVWFSLIDKVWNPTTLRRAFAKVRSNRGAAGVDHITCEQFVEHLETHIEWLTHALRADRYVPQDVRRHWVPKPGRTESALWAFRRSGTGRCRRHCAASSNRSSSGTLPPTATGSGPDAAARTLCDGSRSCWPPATRGRWTPTCGSTSTAFRWRRRHRKGVGRGRCHQFWPNRLLPPAWAVLPRRSSCSGPSVRSTVRPPTGEPDAGKPPVRFEGRGGATQCAVPTPISRFLGQPTFPPCAAPSGAAVAAHRRSGYGAVRVA